MKSLRRSRLEPTRTTGTAGQNNRYGRLTNPEPGPKSKVGYASAHAHAHPPAHSAEPEPRAKLGDASPKTFFTQPAHRGDQAGSAHKVKAPAFPSAQRRFTQFIRAIQAIRVERTGRSRSPETGQTSTSKRAGARARTHTRSSICMQAGACMQIKLSAENFSTALAGAVNGADAGGDDSD